MTGLPQEPLVHNLTPSGHTHIMRTLAFAVIIILLGVGSGWFLATREGSQNSTISGRVGAPGESTAKSGQVVGSKDTQTFSDNTEGTLRDGGVDGEGTHHLERPGGPSQTVYLTSSVLDLSQFVGKKVRVWGETHAAQKAGWLMDVGKIEVL